jgi:2'-5' RNA ligase
MRLGGLGRFGNRVLYVGLLDAPLELRRLADRTTAAARRAGLDRSGERFRPHVTLARSRHGADLAALTRHADVRVPQWRVGECCLVHSVLTGERKYEVLHRFTLDGGV